MWHVKAECEFSLTGNYPSPKIMACNFGVPVIGEESECYILSPTSCLTDERTLIRASRLEFGKHFTKAPVGANGFKTVQNLLMTFLSSSKTEMKGGLSNMLQFQANVAHNLSISGWRVY